MPNVSGKMQAVVAFAPGDYRYMEVDIPRPGRGEILVKVEACGICAGDIKAFQGGVRFWGGNGEPSYAVPPFIPGHEFVGRVVGMGEEAAASRGLRPGDRVIAEQIVPCGGCRFCRAGQYWMCEIHDVYGFKNYLNGGFAEYMIFPRKAIVHKVPENIPTETAVLIEPYACSMHAVERARIEPGEVVVVSGAGPLGLGMVAAARQKDPGKLVSLDLRPLRLQKALALGCDIAANPSSDDIQSLIAGLTDGYGCDVYIEATGHPASVGQGLKLIRKLGRFVEFSVFNDQVTCDWNVVGDGKELDILGVSLSPNCYPKVIAGLADGSLPTGGVVTHRFPLGEFEQAFAACTDCEEAVKVILVPGE